MPFHLAVEDRFAPLILNPTPRMTDQEFLEFCAEHEDLRIESSEAGELVIMPPVGSESAFRNSRISSQLDRWAERSKKGVAFDSSALFALPNGSRRSPDACWISKERLATVPKNARALVWRVCPEFVIELRSATDSAAQLDLKMEMWIANGTQLGWLIDPAKKAVAIYRPGERVQVLKNADQVKGEGPVAGFTLKLKDVWAGVL
ncbi:MAG: Uma2 family endonuclease [Bryobacteraceae bacterium]|nr:Uma2 family endonuclease [Bryobacteraceae bacterium]